MKCSHRLPRRIVIILSIVLMSIFIGMCSFLKTEKDFNVVLITIDTLRADHLSCYGYGRNTSPNIDRITETGIIFNKAIAPSSWTAPSMVSLFTSVYPVNHGVKHGIGYRENQTIHVQEVFASNLVTLAEILKAHGYKTFGVASNLHLSEKFGFGRGFNYFRCLPFLPAPQVNKTVYSWKNEIQTSDKFFLWVHYFDPHFPYYARTPWIDGYTSQELTKELNLSEKEWTEILKLTPVFKKYPQYLDNLIALYDSEINFVDSYIGKLVQKYGFDKDTLLIITSDHGEEFLDHEKLGHGQNLHGETINIPLIIKFPDGVSEKIVSEQASLIDIMPTVLQLLNIDPPEHILGKSLLETNDLPFWLKKMLRRNDELQYVFSELDIKFKTKALLTEEWKYIYDFEKEKGQLHNIQEDPLELNSLANKRVKESSQLKEYLLRWVSEAKKYPAKKHNVQLKPTEKEKLQELEYLQ